MSTEKIKLGVVNEDGTVGKSIEFESIEHMQKAASVAEKITRGAIPKVIAKANGLSPTGSLEKHQLQGLFESGRITKAAYIQLALEFDYPNQRLSLTPEESDEFAVRWSLEQKSHQINRADMWAAIAKYLKAECDESQTPAPSFSFEESELPLFQTAKEEGSN